MFPIGSQGALSPAGARRASDQRGDLYLIAGILALTLLLAFVQWVSGAWTAEFDGHPDEAAQFVSGRMLWEYLRDLPAGNPMEWAGQYYLHYPKVAIGHWPPGYLILEAVWSLAFGSSRTSAMALQCLTGVAALASLYRLARPRFSIPVTFAILLVTIATPQFQQGLSLVMTDLACLLASVMFMHAMMRLLEKPGGSSMLLLFVSLFVAAMIKGTAVCLFPVPFIVVVACGRRIPLQAGWALAGGLCVLVACAAWYAFSSNVIYWGGMTSSIPWPIGNLGGLTGWGFVALAALGLRREPLSILAASMLASATGVSFFVRAMNEPRHWIIVLPAILVLGAYAVTSIPRRYVAVVLAPAVLLFPYGWYRQTRHGYADLVRELRHPARVLISGSSNDEGGFIAQTALAEHYPGSFIVRATKALATSDWNGDNYRLIATTPVEVWQRLDELAIDTVVVAPAATQPRPDQAVLMFLLKISPTWRFCASAGDLSAYCRTMPPVAPRKPLIVDTGGLHLVERIAVGP